MPARTLRDILLRLNAEINKVLISLTVSEKFLASGKVTDGGTPDLSAERLQRETANWAGVIKAAGIKRQ